MPFFDGNTTDEYIAKCAIDAEQKGYNEVLLFNDVRPETVLKIPQGIHTVQFYSSISPSILALLALPQMQHVKSVGIIGGPTAAVIDALPVRFRNTDIKIHGGIPEFRSPDIIAALNRRNGTAPNTAQRAPSLLNNTNYLSSHNGNRNVASATSSRCPHTQPNTYTPPIPTIVPGSNVYNVLTNEGAARFSFWSGNQIAARVSNQPMTAQASVTSAIRQPSQFMTTQACATSAIRPPIRSIQFLSVQPRALTINVPPYRFKQEDEKRDFVFVQETADEIAAARDLLYLDPNYVSDTSESTDESSVTMDTDQSPSRMGRSSVG